MVNSLTDAIMIYEKAESLVKHHGTRELIKIAESEGVKIFYSDKFEKLLGLYTCKWKNRIIILNSNVEEYTMNIVTAHELGHDKLHREIAKNGLMEFALFNVKNTVENEANIFASHLLLDNDSVEEILKQGYTLKDTARILNTDVNILLIKLKEMNKLGYSLPLVPEPDRYFLNKL